MAHTVRLDCVRPADSIPYLHPSKIPWNGHGILICILHQKLGSVECRSDLFAAQGAIAKKGGDLAEQSEYNESAQLAFQNEQFTAQSTAIKEAQQNREITQSLGRTTADVAGAGFAGSGSALDILRSSAQQGAITQAVASQQGLITEASYQVQGQSYLQMANAAGEAAKMEGAAMTGDYIAAGISAVASLMPK